MARRGRKVSAPDRYFHAEKDVTVKTLELVNLGGETSHLLLPYVLQVLQKILSPWKKSLQYQQKISI
jgi:hypothetical protein